MHRMMFPAFLGPNFRTAVMLVCCAFTCIRAEGADAMLSAAWQTGYSGQDVKGAQVLGGWQFKPGAETEDSSGKGNHLKLVGALAAAQGKFDGGLESFPGWPVEDKRHAALADVKAALSPKGAFTIEMWIKP